jgi:hypothetical protein
MPEDQDPTLYQYDVRSYPTHRELAEALNDARELCWEPVSYAIWPYGNAAEHFVILRRDLALFSHLFDLYEKQLQTETDPQARRRLEYLLKRVGRRK